MAVLGRGDGSDMHKVIGRLFLKVLFSSGRRRFDTGRLEAGVVNRRRVCLKLSPAP